MEKNLHKHLVLLFFLIISCFLYGFFLIPEKAYSQSVSSGQIPYGGFVKEETAFEFGKAKAKENLIATLGTSPENLLYVSELTISQWETYLSEMAEISYLAVKTDNNTLQVHATLKNQANLFKDLNTMLSLPKNFLKKEGLWAEEKKITAQALNILDEAAWIRQNVGIGFDKGYNDTLILFTKACKLLTTLDSLLPFYNGLWQNLPYCQSVLESAYDEFPENMFVTTSLAEIYLQTDRPQAALDLIEPIKNPDSFTLYIRALTQVRLKHPSLAEQDLNQALDKTSKRDFLYPDLLVLKGLLSQINNNISQMCESYQEACLYNNCDPYYHTQSLCL